MISIAIMGFGTIGSGVYHVVKTNADVIEKKLNEKMEVKYVLGRREFPDHPVKDVLVHDISAILGDPQVSIVVEAMGGVEPAFTFVSQALEAGKSVVTSNKELLAKKGVELFALAKENNVNFFFGGSVGGGIPIIRPLLRCLSADHIEEIAGILNGTTNYILTKMDREGASFEAALKEAQDNGFAERCPEADVEGHDACRKISILSSIVLGKKVDFEEVYTEGITKITAEDFLYARAIGRSIKLIASSKMEEGNVYAMVAPHLVAPTNPLFAVNDVFNAVMVHGNMVDDIMFYGRGAGSLATASAVVADVLEAAMHPRENIYAGWSAEKQELSDLCGARKQFFVRLRAQKEKKAFLEEIFGAGEIVEVPELVGEIGFVTPVMTEGDFSKALAKVPGVLGTLRLK